MRIVGGKYKGRVFRPNKNFKSRPTTDIAKEGLFNILENRYDFSNKIILDIFSGTGSIGYEFISRGCLEATMVDIDYIHYQFILSVLDKLEIKNARVYRADALKFIQNVKKSFDIIFADPPFNLKNLKEIPDFIFNSPVLKANGLFVLEHPKDFDFSQHKNFREIRKYGKVNFSFFEH